MTHTHTLSLSLSGSQCPCRQGGCLLAATAHTHPGCLCISSSSPGGGGGGVCLLPPPPPPPRGQAGREAPRPSPPGHGGPRAGRRRRQAQPQAQKGGGGLLRLLVLAGGRPPAAVRCSSTLVNGAQRSRRRGRFFFFFFFFCKKGARSSPWFEEPGLSSAESTWAALLKAVGPHLNCASLEKVIRLPEFLKKSSEIVNLQPKPEVFNVGTKQFQWIPLPPHHREINQSKDLSHRNSENQTLGLTGRENKEEERLKMVSLAPEQESLATNEHTVEKSRTIHTTRHSANLGGEERIGPAQLDHQQNSPDYSVLAAKQSHPKNVDSQELWEESTTQSRKNSRRGDEYTGDGLKETSPLESCPMCQMRFSGIWSKLDLDSHLAKCLSESAEDVFWMLHGSSRSLHRNVHRKRAAFRVVWNLSLSLSPRMQIGCCSLMKQARNVDFFMTPAVSVPQTLFCF
ncbi:Fanconi anemia core complex-associated protein 20 isoform X2 [Hemicordylus capensis]|uniref:Fanconi anemia core complex-associated protein 20 isoform X2 n=1 Tax=Hemicordylus capensis TaxID=884348 RepID=UPI0023047677|nr:Fanconi anemia core complex-associated protein 20 isoform X2 [Hemicordylus capensis]